MEQFVNMLVMALLSMPQAMPSRPMVVIDNWPALRVTEHIVAAMPPACNPEGNGCAVINFSERTCDVYVAWREPQKQAARERQLKRCRGYDEAPFRLREAYTRWLAAQPCKPRKDNESRPMVAAVVD